MYNDKYFKNVKYLFYMILRRIKINIILGDIKV